MTREHRPRYRRAILLGVSGAIVTGLAVVGTYALRAAADTGDNRPASRASILPSLATGATPEAPTTTIAPPTLDVVAVSPTSGADNIAGTQPVTVSFSAPIPESFPSPTLTPAVSGNWSRSGTNALVFTPTDAFPPDAAVTVTIPASMRATDGAVLAKPFVAHFSVGNGSVLRLQQLLSLLGYSPLAWAPAAASVPASDQAAQAKAAFVPPAGSFTWRASSWPTQLISQWQPGADNVFTRGMVMAFESDHGLAIDGIAGPKVWSALLVAVAHGQTNTNGYTYALASQTRPETLTVWHDGAQVLQSPANTGIAQAPTADGTFPVYERLRSQVMRGTNPDGTKYADPVQYVAYFNGGDAVHYIPRATFGYPQSVGCVELPLQAAATAWSELSYGTLVTVTG